MQSILALLQFYNTYDHDDIYFSVAKNFIYQFDQISDMSLIEIAEKSYCSPSTITRFCRHLYYSSYPELRLELSRLRQQYVLNVLSTQKKVSIMENKPVGGKNIITQTIDSSLDQFDSSQINSFVKTLQSKARIGFYGYSVPQSVWLLQIDLLMDGKESTAFLDPRYQIEDVQSLDENSFAVFFHYTNDETFSIEQMMQEASQKGAKVALITNTSTLFSNQNVDVMFEFPYHSLALSFIVVNALITHMSLEYQQQNMNLTLEAVH
ncbi:MurR/RpiR family transcriptional regulator [Paenibacillus marinisediminis]